MRDPSQVLLPHELRSTSLVSEDPGQVVMPRRRTILQRQRSRIKRFPLAGWLLSSALAFCLIQMFTCEFPDDGSSLGNNMNQLNNRFLKAHPSSSTKPTEKRQKLQPSGLPENQHGENQDDGEGSKPQHADTTRTLTRVFREAGILSLLSDQERDMLPTLEKTFQDLYGPFPGQSNNHENATSGPLIYGLETCEAYRALVPNPNERYTGPAGMFNTGTNNLDLTLKKNLERGDPSLGHEGSAQYQVPWGKHRMEARRLHHVAPNAEHLNQTQCLPIVIIRDPYHWMQSMCVSRYAAVWKHHRGRCPNLVASPRDKKTWPDITLDKTKLHNQNKADDDGNDDNTEDDNKDDDEDNQEDDNRKDHNEDDTEMTFQVKIEFDDDDVEYFDSLIDLWNDWYRPYWESKYPRLMIRQEDMLLHAPTIVQKVAECMGLHVKHPDEFQYQTNPAKDHGSGTGLLKAIMKTADNAKRGEKLTLKDKIYAAQHLDNELMQAFQYRPITE